MSAYPDFDGSLRETTRRWLRNSEEEQIYAAKSVHDENTDGAKNGLHVTSTTGETDDNESILSWEETSDEVEVPVTPTPLPVRPLGLSRRAGYTQFSDYDVVTVHGARDDHQTAWTSKDNNSNWIEDSLFYRLSIRQLDYVYDTGDSARIYDPSANGITIEANALLDSLAENRLDLPQTECDRPIIWICHDLGGSIVKQALINAMHKQPDPERQDYPGLRKMYRRLPLLTSSIIFLGCPQGKESGEDLEDQLLALMCLPGPPLRTRILPKISHLARQIERANLEFLETKVLDRAIILNITTGPEKHEEPAAADQTEPEQNSAQQLETKKQITDSPAISGGLFSVHDGGLFHTLGIFYMLCLQTTDHLGLVRGHDSSGPDPFDWVDSLSDLFNIKLGYNIKNDYAFLAYQHSLLSLVPPTRVNQYRFYTDGLRRPDLMSWIIEHDVFERAIYLKESPKIVYLHAGQRHQVIDMKSVSQQLYIAYDLVKKDAGASDPYLGCFYFEFDQLDSKRRGIRAMIVSYLCTYVCRFWNDGAELSAYSAAYLRNFKSWSLKDLMILFLRVQQSPGMSDMTVILGQIDQCDEEERSIFLQTILRWQDWNEVYFNFLITTTEPEDSITEILPPDGVISLDDCPVSLDEYLAYEKRSDEVKDRLENLLARRPEFTDLGLHLHQVFDKFRKVPSLQDAVLEWLANYKRGCSIDEATDIVQEVSSDAHRRLLRGLMGQLSLEKQHVVMHIYNWIKYAAEPLTLEMLAEAVRYSLPNEMAQLQYIQSHDEFSRFVMQALGGIILLDGRDIRFSDDTFYEVSETGELNSRQDLACRSHADMATACLRYLLGEEGQKMLRSLSVESHGFDNYDLSWSPIMIPRHSLISYALRFWTVHYQAAGDYRPTDLAIQLLENRWKRQAWIEAVYVTSNPFTRIQKEYVSPLPYMAMFGLDDLIHKQIEDDHRKDGWHQDQWLAIVEAARNGHGKTVTLLLEHSETDVAGLAEALHWAANYGEGGALDILLSKALGIQDFQWPPYILDRAMAAGLEDLGSALVHAGYDLNEEDSDGKRRAVHTAIECGEDRVLKILLDSGRVDLTLENNDGQSPLVLAVHMGNPETIRHLIGAGASIDDCKGQLLRRAIHSGCHEALAMLIDALIHADSDIVNKADDRDDIFVPVIEAATRSYDECVRVLLDRGADPNAVGQDGSALYQAIDKRCSRLCRILLEKGADPNGTTTDDQADNARSLPLMRAIENGEKLMVEMLLDHGAKINVADPNRTDDDTPLSWAIKCGYVDIVRLLLERGADASLVSQEKPDCRSPLYSAAYWRLTDVIEPLIKHGANIHWTNEGTGWSVLHAAYDSADTLSILLQNGLDINATDATNWSTIMWAARYDQEKSIELLLKQTNPKADLEVMSTEEPTSTALHLACQYGRGNAVDQLLEAGADINRQRSDGKFPFGILLSEGLVGGNEEHRVELMLKRRPNLGLADDDGNTVLHNIHTYTPLSVVMRLVEEGAPVNTFNDLGYNPLSWAVRCGNSAVARYLITVKGSQTDVCHETDGSILRSAVLYSSPEVVRLLVRSGAEHSVLDPVHGESVLYSAIGRWDYQERRKIIRYLVEEAGVDVNAAGGKLVNPLMRVVIDRLNDNKPLLKYLLKHGAHTDSTDSLGRSSVHWAALGGKLDELKMLVKNGDDLSVGDNYGRTPLHFAAGKGSLEIVRYILDKLSNGSEASHLDAADVDGWTPIMWACRAQDTMVAEVLAKEYKANLRVRSEDAEWSPLKIARLHGWPYYWADLLEPDLDAQGQDDRESQYYSQSAPGMSCGHDCSSCDVRIVGQAWYCGICSDYLCFKCIRHSKKMHNPEHRFIDQDEYLAELNQGVSGNQSEHEGESGGGSENEEQDEDDSESEEEEDDESE